MSLGPCIGSLARRHPPRHVQGGARGQHVLEFLLIQPLRWCGCLWMCQCWGGSCGPRQKVARGSPMVSPKSSLSEPRPKMRAAGSELEETSCIGRPCWRGSRSRMARTDVTGLGMGLGHALAQHMRPTIWHPLVVPPHPHDAGRSRIARGGTSQPLVCSIASSAGALLPWVAPKRGPVAPLGEYWGPLSHQFRISGKPIRALRHSMSQLGANAQHSNGVEHQQPIRRRQAPICPNLLDVIPSLDQIHPKLEGHLLGVVRSIAFLAWAHLGGHIWAPSKEQRY